MTTIDEGVVRPTAPPAPQGRARSQVEQALAAIARTHAVVDAFTEVLTPARIEPKPLRGVELTAVILMLVGSNRGVAVLPDWVLRGVKSNTDYITRPLGPGTITKRLYAATRAEDVAQPYMAHFLRLGRPEPVKLQREG